MPFRLWFQLLLKRVELHRGQLSYPDLPPPGANYRLLEPLWHVCYILGPQTGLRQTVFKGRTIGLPRCPAPLGKVVAGVSVI